MSRFPPPNQNTPNPSAYEAAIQRAQQVDLIIALTSKFTYIVVQCIYIYGDHILHDEYNSCRWIRF